MFVQEISRDAEGWDQFERDEFQWVTHRDREQWRGVGVGIAKDKFDCVLHKIATKRGIWVVARILGIGRIVLGSLHCHTGVTNSIYQAAIHEFMSKCPRKYRHLPCICGVDANEVPSWIDNEEGGLTVGEGNANLNLLVQEGLRHGLQAQPPDKIFQHAWTHFPRDETRQGRQIDVVLGRQLSVGPITVAADRRLAIGSDHALLFGDIWVADGSLKSRWNHDSRARWVSRELPDAVIVDEDELIHLAKKYTKPRFSAAFRDDRETQEAICAARESNAPADWKTVHRMRTQKRKNWKRERLSSILDGDWDLYRQLQSEKRRKRGWWGDMLAERSAEQLALEIHTHLAEKMKDPRDDFNWDELLEDKIRQVPPSGGFAAFQLHEVCQELQHMRCRSAVGPDQISVHLLRIIVAHEQLGEQLVDLINHIVVTQELPSTWHQSFLALLAKVPCPKKPSDLRPICVSSAFNKLVNKLVCTRVLPALRQGSRVSCCGKGRQAADLVGCISRMRDICREWRHPLLVCKLDVSGAFDRVKRDKVADYLLSKLGDKHLEDELRYMLAQLRTHTLQGIAPGGVQLRLSPDVGIKQGAPESAEVFGLLVDSLLSDLVHCRRWGELGVILEGTDLDLLFFQDDIFLLETDLARLCRRIQAVDRCLAQAGLSLATEKTKIVANAYYTGARRAKIGDEMFVVSPRGESLKILGLNFSLRDDSSEQAREILARTRDAAAAHKDILQAPGAWKRKAAIAKSLVEGQFYWIGGALHWSRQDLHSMNTLQLHMLRSAFNLRRKKEESWLDWNLRTLRFVRVWMHANSVPRWSLRILELQYMLHGHWARRTEIVRGVPCPCPAMKAVQWRCTQWWRHQQSLSPSVSMRHPGRFYASNAERQLAQSHGNLWFVLAQNRQNWCAERQRYLADWDPKWASGQQLSIRC